MLKRLTASKKKKKLPSPLQKTTSYKKNSQKLCKYTFNQTLICFLRTTRFFCLVKWDVGNYLKNEFD